MITCTVPPGYSCKIEAVWTPEQITIFVVALILLILGAVAVLFWLDKR